MRKNMMLLFAVCLLAGGQAAAKNKQSVTLWVPGSVNGAHLEAGDYRVEVAGAEVIFYRGRKEVARSEVRTQQTDKPADRDSVLYTGGRITEIRTRGKREKLILPADTMARKKSEKTATAN